MKYLSIITNFGCHYQCPYCIVKNNNLKIPKTTEKHLEDKLISTKEKLNCNIISISGGGDPLFNYDNNKSWFDKLFSLTHNIPLELHTSYTTNKVNHPFNKYFRVVYHLREIEQLKDIKKIGNEIVRVVFVVTKHFTKEMLEEISLFAKNSKTIDELSFRQLVDNNYETKYYLDDYLKKYHKIKWYYITQNDYNCYFAGGKVYTHFEDFRRSE